MAVPTLLVAETVTVKVTTLSSAVPEIRPVAVSMSRPLGSPSALNDVGNSAAVMR